MECVRGDQCLGCAAISRYGWMSVRSMERVRGDQCLVSTALKGKCGNKQVRMNKREKYGMCEGRSMFGFQLWQ